MSAFQESVPLYESIAYLYKNAIEIIMWCVNFLAKDYIKVDEGHRFKNMTRV